MPSIVRKISPFFTDDRGEMSHLLTGNEIFTSAVLITCKKGAIRANHYHKTDTHYSYMLSGSMEYTYKPFGKAGKGTTIIIKKGEVVWTPPQTIHAMRFLEDSVFIALTTESRSQKKYEEDTIKVKLIA